MANGVTSDDRCSTDSGLEPRTHADYHVVANRDPRARGRKSLVSQDVGDMLVIDGISTQASNGSHPVLPRAPAAPAPAVRGPARVLRRGDAVDRSGPSVRLYAGSVPC